MNINLIIIFFLIAWVISFISIFTTTSYATGWGTTISPNKKIALTETDGLYAFTKLEAGTYNIIARKKGYKRSDDEERELREGEGTEVYFKLQEK